VSGLVVDSFAGGGGASLGIELGLGRSPDLAINHDPEAVAMHAANHPATRHFCRSVWQIDPIDAVGGRPVELLWASPDCKHFSKAKGARPVRREIRDLAWVVVLWAKRARPAVICLENVEEFRDWGPLGLDGRPCAERRGQTFDRWVGELRRLGYRVQWRELRACDYGAPTIRKRLFLIARRDGQRIVWPEPTHGAPDSPGVLAGRLEAWRTAADCLDWSLPCPSIFLSREDARAIGVNRPLAEATLARIARGVRRYVLEAAQPFIVPITHTGDVRVHAVGEPLRTVTTAHRGELALAAPFLSAYYGPGRGGQDRSADPMEPLRTQTTENRHSLVAAFLAQHNGGMVGHDAREPVSTLTAKGSHQQLVATSLVKLRGTCRDGQPVAAPMPTVTASGQHVAEVRAFLLKYYGEGSQSQDCRDPLHTIPARDRFSVVTVAGERFELVDIGMRMLAPRELFRAQGFPDSYVIDPMVDGRPLTKTAQIRMCGNSVCPQVAAAIVSANLGARQERAAA
jgi:DNA (cytosine-5)-methyltransferase 1